MPQRKERKKESLRHSGKDREAKSLEEPPYVHKEQLSSDHQTLNGSSSSMWALVHWTSVRLRKAGKSAAINLRRPRYGSFTSIKPAPRNSNAQSPVSLHWDFSSDPQRPRSAGAKSRLMSFNDGQGFHWFISGDTLTRSKWSPALCVRCVSIHCN